MPVPRPFDRPEHAATAPACPARSPPQRAPPALTPDIATDAVGARPSLSGTTPPGRFVLPRADRFIPC